MNEPPAGIGDKKVSKTQLIEAIQVGWYISFYSQVNATFRQCGSQEIALPGGRAGVCRDSGVQKKMSCLKKYTHLGNK